MPQVLPRGQPVRVVGLPEALLAGAQAPAQGAAGVQVGHTEGGVAVAVVQAPACVQQQHSSSVAVGVMQAGVEDLRIVQAPGVGGGAAAEHQSSSVAVGGDAGVC
jgi:hypothetical protein